MTIFLDKIVTAAEVISNASPKQMLSVKDKYSRYVYCSDYLLTLIGIGSSDILNKVAYLPLYGNDPDFEKIIVNEDQKIMASGQSQTLLKINKFPTGFIPYFCQKSPLINPETNQVEGILLQGYEVGFVNFQNYFLNETQSIKNKNVGIHLTKREKEVIYFFMTNLSSQEIAEVLSKMGGKSISKSTIDSVFNEQLYLKFKAYSRPELYQKLKNAGFDNKIPQELLRSGSFFLSAMEVY